MSARDSACRQRSTIHRWKNPAAAERDRERSRAYARRVLAEKRALRADDPHRGLTGLSRKVAMIEDRLAAVEERIAA